MDPLVEVLESLADGPSQRPDEPRPTLRAGKRSYDSSRFVETVYKTGNYLRHCGVHEASVVELLPSRAPEIVFGMAGTWLLGGQVAPVPTAEEGVDEGSPSSQAPDVRLGQTTELPGPPVAPGCTLLGFGAEPADPSWAYFEREIWSENPFFPEVDHDPDRSLFAPERADAQLDTLLSRAESIADDLGTDDTVAIRASLLEPGTVVAGLFAPLLAGTTVLLPSGSQTGTVAVAEGAAPEPRTINPSAVDSGGPLD